MFEPTSGLWKELMERAEGKVIQPVDLSGEVGLTNNDDTKSEILSKLARIATATGADKLPGESE
jgi:hypothetical protein